MSKKVKNLRFVKKIVKIKKNSQFIDYSIIEYSEEKINEDILNFMKKGYLEMAEINLEFSRIPFECESANINEYENWLCGVWYF